MEEERQETEVTATCCAAARLACSPEPGVERPCCLFLFEPTAYLLPLVAAPQCYHWPIYMCSALLYCVVPSQELEPPILSLPY